MKLRNIALATVALVALAHPSEAAASDLTHHLDISLGLDGAGPMLFRDTPDGQLNATSAFRNGMQLALRLGNPATDAHAFGLGLGYAGLARSEGRHLSAYDTQLLYAAGGATEVQVGLGYRVGLASDGFRLSDGTTPYGGPLGSVSLRHIFLQEDQSTPLGLAASLFAEGVAHGTWSTAFVGTRVELLFRKSS